MGILARVLFGLTSMLVVRSDEKGGTYSVKSWAENKYCSLLIFHKYWEGYQANALFWRQYWHVGQMKFSLGLCILWRKTIPSLLINSLNWKHSYATQKIKIAFSIWGLTMTRNTLLWTFCFVWICNSICWLGWAEVKVSFHRIL